MKIVKLNRNFTIYKNHRFEIGIKFASYDPNGAGAMAKQAGKLFGTEAFMWKYYPNELVKGDWATGFGSPRPNGKRPYWVYLRNESMLSMLLLSLEASHG